MIIPILVLGGIFLLASKRKEKVSDSKKSVLHPPEEFIGIESAPGPKLLGIVENVSGPTAHAMGLFKQKYPDIKTAIFDAAELGKAIFGTAFPAGTFGDEGLPLVAYQEGQKLIAQSESEEMTLSDLEKLAGVA